jgi:hypothetical protein
MFKKLFLFAVITSLFLTVSILAQSSEYEPVKSSNLTSVSLPGGAQRVFPNHVPSEINQTLGSIIARSEGKLRQGESEVLLWTGGDLKRSGATTIVNRLADTLKVAGWKFEVGGTENGVTFFSVLRDGANRRALIGFYGEADGTLVFAWSELHIAGDEQTNSNLTSYNQGGNVSDYSFTTPAGWSRQDSAGKIVLSKGSANKIEFLPLMNSSGNLERDAERIIWQVFKGYDAWYSNGFEADWGTFEKGTTAQGLEYYRVYRYAKKASEENNGFAQSKFDAIILLVKLGGKVAVIAGSQPFQSDYARDSTLSAIDLLLYDLSFKSVSDSHNLKNELLGSWSAASGSVALAYTFNANGTFHKGAAHEFRIQHDPETQKVKTTSYGMTQSYSLSGNILTQNYQQTGQVAKYKIRIYYTKYDKDAWQYKLGFLPLESSDGGTIVLRRSS